MNQRFPMTLKMIDPDIYDPSVMETFPAEEAAIELSAENCMFLAGLIRRYRPKTLLEVGVSAGGSSALLLHALDKLGLESELVSVDLMERWNKDAAFATGWAAKKLYPDKENWQLHTGKYLPEIIETLDTEFDFCFLDTVHMLPGEMLDYLVVLPFMREGGIIAMHDTALYYWTDAALATRVLYDACVGKKITPPQRTQSDANLSAFQITEDTYRYVGNIFSALCMPWGQFIDPEQFHIYQAFFKKYYGEEAADWFARIWKWNNSHLINTRIRGRLARQRAAHSAGRG
ncbi:MAG: class I SAM-dependent methyltransferase [Desulfovibrio sp.]|nr:class I SAM-dependent methyltransferase [Desulfovibrio sp.]